MSDSYTGGYPGGASGGSRPPSQPRCIAKRYELCESLGAGGFGVVYRARDLLRGEDVAIKLLTAAGRAQSTRREVVALRGLRLPGVVQLIDEGTDERGQGFLVMELVVGEPFPGALPPAPWPHVGNILAELLVVLGRVHEAGVIHLDLKPANIKVTPAGAVVLLDLGLACGPALGGAAPPMATAGTRRYMAPEHRRSGQVSVTCDLYAVGVMLMEALTRRAYVPGAVGVLEEAARAAGVPSAVCSLIARLSAPVPEERPASAWEALDELERLLPGRPAAFVPALPPGQDPVPAPALRQCFSGPERLFHLPGDASRALWERTRGERDAVVAELRTWIRLGVAVPEPGGSRLRVDRSSLGERVLTPAGHDRWGLSLGGRAEMEPQAVLGMADALISDGAFESARALLDQTLRLIRRGSADAGIEVRLLSLWTRMALEERDRALYDLALYELGRATTHTPEIEALATLVRWALGEKAGENERAQERLDELAPFSDPALERWRYELRLRIARSKEDLAEEEGVLMAMRAWAEAHGTPDITARVLDSMGWLEYRRGAFDKAATLQEQAYRLAKARTVRLAIMLNGASAWMEAANYKVAEAQAQAGHDEAEQHRYPLFEARAAWLLRAIQYRTDRTREPDLELVEAAAFLDVAYLEGNIALGEGAVAWRAGLLAVGIELAELAERRFEAARGMKGGKALARALRLACLGNAADAGEVAALGHTLVKEPLPDFDWQALGMLLGLPGGAPFQGHARHLASRAPRPTARRELLAPCEVLAITAPVTEG